MYCVVILVPSKRKLVIPTEWIQQFSCATNIANGLRGKTIRIFYAQDKKQRPNFSTEIRKGFSKQIRGCYNAKFLKAFGMCKIRHIGFQIKQKESHCLTFFSTIIF